MSREWIGRAIRAERNAAAYSRWHMAVDQLGPMGERPNPFAVRQKTHSVYGRGILDHEAELPPMVCRHLIRQQHSVRRQIVPAVYPCRAVRRAKNTNGAPRRQIPH